MSLQLCLFHGGQYQPPPEESGPIELDGIVSQPGLGPVLKFDPTRWEWWFDANQEGLVDARYRMARRAAGSSRGYQPVTDRDRNRIVLPVLMEATGHRHRDVRAAAAMALARMQLPAATAAVAALAENDADLFVRTQSLLALGYSGDARALQPLVSVWEESSNQEMRSYAIVGLGLLGLPEANAMVRDALEEKALRRQGNMLRAAVVYAAGITGDPDLGDRLAALLDVRAVAGEAPLRAQMAAALGRLSDRRFLPAVLELVSDGDSQVRRSAAMAVEALAPVLTPADLPLLLERLDDDPDSTVHFALLRALGRSRTPQARAFLRQGYQDARYRYRPYYALALAFDAHPDNIPLLLEGLEAAREASEQGALALALGLLEAQAAVEPLLELLETERVAALQGYVALALGLIDAQDQRVATQLERLARGTRDVEVARLSLLALGLVGAGSRLESLAEGFEPGSSAIDRAARVYGLGLAGDRRVLRDLLAVAADPEEVSYVRAYALQALAELCDPRDVPPPWRLSRHVDLTQDIGFLFEMYRSL